MFNMQPFPPFPNPNMQLPSSTVYRPVFPLPNQMGHEGFGDMDPENMHNVSRKRPRGEDEEVDSRKESHNIAEKRRRDKINEKIDELAMLISNNPNKANKASILGSAVDQINALEARYQELLERNRLLKNENSSLKQAHSKFVSSLQFPTDGLPGLPGLGAVHHELPEHDMFLQFHQQREQQQQQQQQQQSQQQPENEQHGERREGEDPAHMPHSHMLPFLPPQFPPFQLFPGQEGHDPQQMLHMPFPPFPQFHQFGPPQFPPQSFGPPQFGPPHFGPPQFQQQFHLQQQQLQQQQMFQQPPMFDQSQQPAQDGQQPKGEHQVELQIEGVSSEPHIPTTQSDQVTQDVEMQNAVPQMELQAESQPQPGENQQIQSGEQL